MKKWTGGEKNDIFKKEKGKVLAGVFKGMRSVTTTNGVQKVYTVEQKGGVSLDVWGDSILDNFFPNIKIGSTVMVKYLGKEVSEKTKRTYHNYEIEYDDEGIQGNVASEEDESLVKQAKDIFN